LDFYIKFITWLIFLTVKVELFDSKTGVIFPSAPVSVKLMKMKPGRRMFYFSSIND